VIGGVEWWALAICLAVVAIGAAIQGLIGMGMGLLAAPILTLVEPSFLPVSMVVAVIPLSIGVAVRDWEHVQWRHVGLALTGRLPGVVVGAWAAATTGEGFLAVVISVTVLVAVAASVTGFRIATTDRNLVLAGCASGFTATAAGTGGPPIAITYQHQSPKVMRATLSVFFTAGATISLVALSIAGQVGRTELELSAALLPAVGLGFLASKPLVGRVPEHLIRTIVLTLCTVAALMLLAGEAM
jgi:uncharacterized membrane protein YfcA